MKFAVFLLVFVLIHGSMCTSLRKKKHQKPPTSHEDEIEVPKADEKPSQMSESEKKKNPSISEPSSHQASSHQASSHQPSSHQPSNHQSLSHEPAAGKSPSHEKQSVSSPNQQLKAPMYAFSALLNQGTVISDDTLIVFGRVLANVGGYYVNNSGQFVCPDDGLYVFMWSIEKDVANDVNDEGMRCITSLRQSNNRYKFGPKTSYFSTVASGSTEMMTVLQCTTLTAITINTESWSDTEQISNYEAKSSFSGFKLASSIGFTAELSADQSIFPGSKIIFDTVLADFGDNYNSIHGFFRCPDDGIYVFSVSAYTTNSNTPWSVSRLMKEGEVVIQGPITYIATAAYDSGSNSITAVVQCSAGQSIYVETAAAHDFQFNSYSPQLTSFTGFKLYDATDPGVIAFTAVMSSNFSSIGDSEVLPINQIITNVGNSYDSALFAFICPDDDYYMFSWTAAANYGGGGATSDIALYKEETRLTHLYLSPQTDNVTLGTSGSSTYSTVVQCTSGNRFQLRRLLGSARVFLGGYTVFSGYKIPGEI